MALNITQYVDPGVYIGEVVVPGAVSVATVPLVVCLVGIGSRNKRANNEALTRGLVSNEALTVGVTGGAHDATLINVSNRKSAQLVVSKDGLALDSTFVSFLPATKAGVTLTTLDFSTNNKISLSMDGKQPVTIALSNGAGATTIVGSLISAQTTLSSAGAAATAAQISTGINKALNDASSLGYGPAYGGVASSASNIVSLTSPLSTSASDIKLFQSYPSAHSQTVAVFGGSVPFQAPTTIRIADSQYNALSTYTASYVATNTDIDVLSQSNVQSMVRVGAFAGVTTFKEATDYTRSSSNLDWSIDSAASYTSSVAAATHDVSSNDTLVLALDGKAAITIDLNGLGSPPPGYANPASAAAATPAEIVNNINAILAAAANYGPEYRAVATVSGSGGNSKLVLTSPRQGAGSYVQLAAPSTSSAVTALFGLSSTQLPYSVNGGGVRPSPGVIYFATYEYTRPNGDYNAPKRYFTPDSLYTDVGFPLLGNALAIAGSISFENNAPSVMIVQVNDVNFPGSPTQPEFLTALNAAGTTSTATEICALTTNLGTQTDVLNHVIAQSSATEKNYRRGWFGMARNTTIGDKDTPDTFVYRAVRTFQVPGDSPGRGRLILVAPSNVTRTITKEDGSQADLSLDGSYLATAVAARMTSFTSPADTLLRKNISGFKIADFQTYLKGERGQLASNGVTVVTLDAGKLALLDPITTEAGGGRMASFQEVSASTQKDAVTTAMTQSVDSNLVGVVPSDLASFIITIKGYVGGVLRGMIAAGSIAPFKTDTGVTRDIDFSKDIQVFQDKTDPTRYYFRYFFNLRYPAKRFFGEYSVDNPFFT